jgi:hypothetical protein
MTPTKTSDEAAEMIDRIELIRRTLANMPKSVLDHPFYSDMSYLIRERDALTRRTEKLVEFVIKVQTMPIEVFPSEYWPSLNVIKLSAKEALESFAKEAK